MHSGTKYHDNIWSKYCVYYYKIKCHSCKKRAGNKYDNKYSEYNKYDIWASLQATGKRIQSFTVPWGPSEPLAFPRVPSFFRCGKPQTSPFSFPLRSSFLLCIPEAIVSIHFLTLPPFFLREPFLLLRRTLTSLTCSRSFQHGNCHLFIPVVLFRFL